MVSRRALDRIYEKVLAREGTIAYRDFEALLEALGFTRKGQKGSHRIYLHPAVGRPFPVQPDGKDAKRYQIRQLRDMIHRYRLTLDPNA
jgi:predicted RNA binding protein YcfA (HicA-like mRNA interferase family)